MPKLFYPLPSTVTVDGESYDINTDFRVWIEIEKILCSSKLDSAAKFARCFALAYRQLPPNPVGALEALMNFYSLGHTVKNTTHSHSPSTALYNYDADGEYIFGSFMSQYGIDLSETPMHWWKFKSLLACLDENCKFSRVISYRNIDTSSIKDSEKRRFYEKMKRLYALSDNRTPEEMEIALTESIEALF